MQRLELLYSGKYDLQTKEDEEVFVVDLQVELIRIEKTQQFETAVQPQQTTAYA